jgi:response regulator RpfG family c-di-GMP phosphodiesterase
MDHRVLIVDGDKSVLLAVARALRKLGLRSVGTTSATEAIDLARAQRFAVAIVEQDLCDMGGTTLLVKLRDVSPETVRVVLTGSADLEHAQAAINEGAVYRYLQKPWHGDHLRMEIRQAVDHHVLCAENRRLQRVVNQMNQALKHQNRHLDRRVREFGEEVQGLHGELRASTDAAVAAIAALASAHSDGIGEHGSRVAELCAQVGRRLGLPAEALRDLDVAARLHDIGKIGLSSQALHFPEEYLRPEELELLRAHSEKGEAVLRKLFGLQAAAGIVRHHHEHWDGSGYPDGLAGEEIPVPARILAACDALDERMHPMDDSEPVSAQDAFRAMQAASPERFDSTVLRALGEYLDPRLAA